MIYPFMGKSPNLHPSCFVVPSAEIIGDVTAGENVSFFFNTVVRGDVHWIKIGDDTNVQDGSVLHVQHKKSPLTIGKGVTIGHSVTVHGCTIGDYCLLGMRAVILDDAVVGEECIIGAGALVTQKQVIPPRSLVLGSPAKVVRPLKEDELAFLRQSAENYKNYIKMYRSDGKFPELLKGNAK